MTASILTVDDSVSVRMTTRIALTGAGYKVTEAVDGLDGLNKAKATRFDLVITDLNMPNMDGVSLIKSVRADQRFKFMPILMLTTESQESRKQEGRAAGATGWIVKPFNPEQLLAVIRKVLG